MTHPTQGLRRNSGSTPPNETRSPTLSSKKIQQVAKRNLAARGPSAGLQEEKKRAPGTPPIVQSTYAYPHRKKGKGAMTLTHDPNFPSPPMPKRRASLKIGKSGGSKQGSPREEPRAPSPSSPPPVLDREEMMAQIEIAKKKQEDYIKANPTPGRAIRVEPSPPKLAPQPQPRVQIAPPKEEQQKAPRWGEIGSPRGEVLQPSPREQKKGEAKVGERMVPRLQIASPKGEQREGDPEGMPGEETYMLPHRPESPSDTLVLSPGNQRFSPGGEEEDEVSTLRETDSPSPRGEQTEGAESGESLKPQIEDPVPPLHISQVSPRREQSGASKEGLSPRSRAEVPLSPGAPQASPRVDQSKTPWTGVLMPPPCVQQKSSREQENLEEESKGAYPLVLSKYRGGGGRVGGDGELRAAYMEPLQISLEPAVPQAGKFSLIRGDTINPAELNYLIPQGDRLASKQIFQLEGGSQFEIAPVYATPEQIDALKLTAQDIAKVKRLAFSRSSITDAQLAALVRKFPFTEAVELVLCWDLTDEGLSALQRLKLKSFQSHFCINTSPEKLLALSFDDLVDFGLSTEEEIPRALTQKLAQAKKVKRVSFDLCPHFGPDAVLDFQDAIQDGDFEISAVGCPLMTIPEEEEEQLNQELDKNRGDQPIHLQLGNDQKSQHFIEKLPEILAVAKKIQETDDILSRETLRKRFPHRHPGILPDASQILEFNFTIKPKNKNEPPRPLRGFDLVGDIPGERINESVNALAKKCPDLQVISIRESEKLSHLGITCLRQFLKAKILKLEKLRGVTAKMIEAMLSDNRDSKAWQELEEISLVGLPVTDEALRLISHFPALKSVNVSGCKDFTVQGLFHFLKRCRTLRSLTILDCPSIDPFAIEEFERTLPGVLISNPQIDKTAIDLAIHEADSRILLGKELFFDFMGDLFWKEYPILMPDEIDENPEKITAYYMKLFKRLGLDIPFNPNQDAKEQWLHFIQILQFHRGNLIPITAEINGNAEEITAYYMEWFKRLGIDIPFNPNQDVKEQWIRFDQILQAYMSISRVAWAYRKNLKQVAFFTNVESEKPPEIVKEIIALKSFKNDMGEYPYIKKLKKLDLSDLSITFLPSFIEKEEWPQLININLQGTFITQLSEKFKNGCPRLEAIEYSDNRVEDGERFLTEEIKPFRVEARPAFSDESFRELGKDDRVETDQVATETFKKILEKVRAFKIYYADLFTFRGLQTLYQCPLLTDVSITHCRSLDVLAIEDFIKKRPEITFIPHIQIFDESANQLAIEEADRRMLDPLIQREFYFHRDFTHLEVPLPENVKHGFDIGKAIRSYREQLAQIGITEKIDSEAKNIMAVLMRCDQILQSYYTLFRTAREIERELFHKHTFANLEQEMGEEIDRQRMSIGGVIGLLEKNCETHEGVQKALKRVVEDEKDKLEINQSQAQLARLQKFADKIQALNFSHLGIFFIPDYILKTQWSRLTAIDLRGTKIANVSDSLIKNCPKLLKIHYPEGTEIIRLAPAASLSSVTILELIALKNIDKAIRLLNMKDNEEVYADQITSLDFSGINLQKIPDFILKTHWKNVTTIDLRTTQIYEFPSRFKKQCPKLKDIYLPEKEEAPPQQKSPSLWERMWTRRIEKKED